ncbi:MAG: hypothetical protein FWD36_07305 [Treponema sp.]|nr:hypothetical protein [Treponema sp.]
MTKEEKIDKLTHDFSLLPEEKQDYILGVLQALVFAHEELSGVSDSLNAVKENIVNTVGLC